MGRKRTPIEILKLRDSKAVYARRKERNADLVDALDIVPDPPNWLDSKAKAVWAEILPSLVASRSIAETDLFVLAILCNEYAFWQRTIALAESIDPGTLVWARLQSQANQTLSCIMKILKKFSAKDNGTAQDGKDDTGKTKFFSNNG